MFRPLRDNRLRPTTQNIQQQRLASARSLAISPATSFNFTSLPGWSAQAPILVESFSVIRQS
jgi:hypothetical protein